MSVFKGDGVKGADHGAHGAGLALFRILHYGFRFRIASDSPCRTSAQTSRRFAMPAGNGKSFVFHPQHPHIDLAAGITDQP
jgi:hypothetical protein